jgi:hypothetical protein
MESPCAHSARGLPSLSGWLLLTGGGVEGTEHGSCTLAEWSVKTFFHILRLTASALHMVCTAIGAGVWTVAC